MFAQGSPSRDTTNLLLGYNPETNSKMFIGFWAQGYCVDMVELDGSVKISTGVQFQG